MKISLKIFITILIITVFINQVNSVGKHRNFGKKSFITTKKNNFICENSLDITSKMKQKHIQEMSLSCEISATADILSFLLSKKITEKELLKKLEKSEYNKIPQKNKWEIYWGNPEEGFVWYIDKIPNWEIARQRKITGYWVLEKPIEKIINNYWFKTTTISKYDYSKKFNEKNHLKLILENLKKWNMVQLWWDICTDPKYYSEKEHICSYNWKLSWNQNRDIYWNYIDKNWNKVKYKWLNWEHAFYLLWYKWEIDNPTHIIVWDTFTGRHTYVLSEWMRKWKKMEYRSIIIYKK